MGSLVQDVTQERSACSRDALFDLTRLVTTRTIGFDHQNYSVNKRPAAVRRPGAAAVLVGIRGGIRARSSIRRPRRGSWFP